VSLDAPVFFDPMPRKRVSIVLKPKYAMVVTRIALGRKKLVYVILAQKALKYPWGRSRIAYIGTTKKGMSRFAQSATAKADDVLKLHGVREMEVRVIRCGAIPNVQTWVKLERAMIFTFRRLYGDIPKCNKVGKGFRERDEFRYVSSRRVESVLRSLA
jgi:hypothetical protein